jgi:hypothetical protein
MQRIQTGAAVSPPALWQLAFRAGFLLAASFAVLGMARWLYWTIWPERWDFTLSPPWWHAHEMVFGFALPVVAGFLLTAVATWTGLPGTRGWRLQLLFGLWLASRCLLWLLPGQLFFAWLAEMLFIALLIYELTQRVWAVRQWRNMLFPPVLLALALFNSASYWYADDPGLSMRLHYGCQQYRPDRADSGFVARAADQSGAGTAMPGCRHYPLRAPRTLARLENPEGASAVVYAPELPVPPAGDVRAGHHWRRCHRQ